MRAFPRRPGHSTENGWYKVFELKTQHLVDCNKSPLGETSQRYMRDLEYQFHTTVEIVWVALLSFVLLSHLFEEGKTQS